MGINSHSVRSISLTANALLQSLIVFMLIMILSACVSTGGEKKQAVMKPAKQDCTAVNTAGGEKSQSETESAGGASRGNCLPAGVIEITENYGVDPEVREEFNRAIESLNQENYEEGIRLLKAVSGKTSKFSAPYINLGIAYARTNELEKAEESFKKALEISKLHPVAQNELGLIYRKTGRYKEARELYESLLATYPDFLPARKNLGVLCDIYIQDLSCALNQYEEYLEAVPNDEKVKIWVADVKGRM